MREPETDDVEWWYRWTYEAAMRAVSACAGADSKLAALEVVNRLNKLGRCVGVEHPRGIAPNGDGTTSRHKIPEEGSTELFVVCGVAEGRFAAMYKGWYLGSYDDEAYAWRVAEEEGLRELDARTRMDGLVLSEYFAPRDSP